MEISEIRDYSWMSQASYLGLEEVLYKNDELLRLQLVNDSYAVPKRFSTNQSLEFIDPTTGYSFIDQRPNTLWEGFSATVFSSNSLTNNYTIAVRGTEDANDPFRDLLKEKGTDLFFRISHF